MTHSSQQVEIVLTTYTFWGQHEHCSSLPVSTMVGIQGLPGRDGIGTNPFTNSAISSGTNSTAPAAGTITKDHPGMRGRAI